MTFRQAAEEVLRRSKRSMTADEITERALERGLISTRGQTPVATMAATLYRDLGRGVINREFEPGPQRARRGSVRWKYTGGNSRA